MRHGKVMQTIEGADEVAEASHGSQLLGPSARRLSR
ncbi:hypothetical protein STRAU_2491 [Streptomyces aurantiacus JA 4570]|uniref:Uncharacterized protein n=1 Tax=Streptomyces aurantiacus JA 4570 TaxID=1286094 RepID=S3ZLM2_9ACTN|nr:hypothetical protein STRAU_2491 [Streptomyces aurantiacus JA 4570]